MYFQKYLVRFDFFYFIWYNTLEKQDVFLQELKNLINKGFKRRKLKEILHFKSSLVYHTKGLFYFLIPFILNKQDF